MALVAGSALIIIYNILDGASAPYLSLQAFKTFLVTMAFCLAIGLPIRMNSKINSWWRVHQLIPIAGAIIGSLTMLLGYYIRTEQVNPMDARGGVEVLIIPHPFVSICGWSLAMFCLLHLYLPIPRRSLWARPVE